MKISQIDKNFAVHTAESSDMTDYPIPCLPFDLYGLQYAPGKGFYRMPHETAEKINDGVAHLCSNTSGGRLRFSANSHKIKITVTYDSLCRMSHMTLTGSGGFVLLDVTDKYPALAATFFPNYDDENGFSRTATLRGDGSVRDYILYFPLYNDVKSLTVSLEAGCYLSNGKKYRSLAPIVYYGSSITQGGCASRPDNAYPALLSLRQDVDFINLGFSGSARGEKAMAEYISSLPCSILVMDYDHNAPSAEHLESTHFDFYKTFRGRNPGVPIIFVSKPDPDSNPTDAKNRFAIIKQTYLTALKNGDKDVYLIDGRKFFGRASRDPFTVDGCHPNSLGFYKMAEKLQPLIDRLLKKAEVQDI